MRFHRARNALATYFGASTLLLASAALATGGGFESGQLSMYTNNVQGGTPGGSVMTFHPVSGQAAILADAFHITNRYGTLAYDPFRDRLLLQGKLGATTNPIRLHALDASGGAQTIAFAGLTVTDQLAALAPSRHGRVYFGWTVSGTSGQLRYLDASNNVHILLDASGAAPFVVPTTVSTPAEMMLYHGATNSLLLAQGGASAKDCAGATTWTGVVVRRVPLTADGSRVAGAVQCSHFDAVLGGTQVVGFQWKNDGNAILFVDTNIGGAKSRMIELDPDTLSLTAFAANGPYTGDPATWGGGWSTLLGRAVLLDAPNDVFRTYAAGQSGGGAIIPTTIPPSTPLSQNDVATLLEIPFDPCTGALHGYGTGKAGAGGWIPALGASGCPVPGASFEVSLSSIVGGANGLLFVGFAKATQPFLGGTLLVSPIALAIPLTMPGTPGVAGAAGVTLPALLPADPLLSGIALFAQAAFADVAATNGLSLTAGLEIRIG